jgi:hypothetical protein
MRIVTTKRQNSGVVGGSSGRSARLLIPLERTPAKDRKTRRRGPGAAIHSGDYRTPRRAAGLVPRAAAGLLLALLASCATPPPATVPTGAATTAPTEAVASGDWDDADAAVRTAVRRAQMAIESRRAFRSAGDDETTVLVYTLRTVRGDSGELTLKRQETGGIRIRCRVGAMGSARAEREVVDGVVARLRRLRGRDYAPAGG